MKVVSIFAMVLVVLALLATVGLFAFQEALQRAECHIDAAALGVLAVALVGCIMGFVSFREAAGKVSAIVGALLVGFYAYQFVAPVRCPLMSAQNALPPAARLRPVSLDETTAKPSEQAPPRREVVVVMPKEPQGSARFEGFNDLRIISTGGADGPVDNQNYELHVGGYVGPFIGPGGCQWVGRFAWPGPGAGSAFYLRYGTDPHEEPSGIVSYGAGGN